MLQNFWKTSPWDWRGLTSGEITRKKLQLTICCQTFSHKTSLFFLNKLFCWSILNQLNQNLIKKSSFEECPILASLYPWILRGFKTRLFPPLIKFNPQRYGQQQLSSFWVFFFNFFLSIFGFSFPTKYISSSYSHFKTQWYIHRTNIMCMLLSVLRALWRSLMPCKLPSSSRCGVFCVASFIVQDIPLCESNLISFKYWKHFLWLYIRDCATRREPSVDGLIKNSLSWLTNVMKDHSFGCEMEAACWEIGPLNCCRLLLECVCVCECL